MALIIKLILRMVFGMEKLNKFSSITAGVLGILHFVGIIAMGVCIVMSFAAKETMARLFSDSGMGMKVYGFELSVLNVDGMVDFVAVRIFCITAIIIFVLMAMVFRNIYLIFKTAKGKTKFAKGDTPFQKAIVRMVREIGIFYLAIPIVGLIMSIIARLILGVDSVEVSMDLGGFVTGILILSLSQVFAYGLELQTDVDGLL